MGGDRRDGPVHLLLLRGAGHVAGGGSSGDRLGACTVEKELGKMEMRQGYIMRTY